MVGRAVPGATVASVDDESALKDYLGQGALLLINRVLDSGFAAESGVELIRQIRAGKTQAAAMLISNHEDAQTEAIEAGALRGFGKSQVHSETTAQRVREAAKKPT